MASEAEMRRLILHAADLLRDAPDLSEPLSTVAGSVRLELAGPLLAHTVAETYAEAVLRMVATCLADDNEGAPDAD